MSSLEKVFHGKIDNANDNDGGIDDNTAQEDSNNNNDTTTNVDDENNGTERTSTIDLDHHNLPSYLKERYEEKPDPLHSTLKALRRKTDTQRMEANEINELLAGGYLQNKKISHKDKDKDVNSKNYTKRKIYKREIGYNKRRFHTIQILSGKGGVGKSMFAMKLAKVLTTRGFNIGVLDLDLSNPNIPYFAGIDSKDENIFINENGLWEPKYVEISMKNIDSNNSEDDNNNNNDDDGITSNSKVMKLPILSSGFLLDNPDESLSLVETSKDFLIRHMLHEVNWSTIDYLIIDTPPGISAEHISLQQYLSKAEMKYKKIQDFAIIITTPDDISKRVVEKQIDYVKKTKLALLGLVENMTEMELINMDKTKKTKTVKNDNKTKFIDKNGKEITQHVLDLIAKEYPEVTSITISDLFGPAESNNDNDDNDNNNNNNGTEDDIFNNKQSKNVLNNSKEIELLGKIPFFNQEEDDIQSENIMIDIITDKICTKLKNIEKLGTSRNTDLIFK